MIKVRPTTMAASLVFVTTLASCVGPREVFLAPRWKWSPNIQGQFTTSATPGKKVFYAKQDVEELPELDSLKKELMARFTDKTQGFGLDAVTERKDADYTCCTALRYFGPCPSGDDKLASFLSQEAGKKIAAGFPDWVEAGQERGNPDVPSFIPVEGASMLNLTSPQWVLIIDIAVGEKGGDEKMNGKVISRTGRLVGWVEGDLDRSQALYMFMYGKAPWLALAPDAPKPALEFTKSPDALLARLEVMLPVTSGTAASAAADPPVRAPQ